MSATVTAGGRRVPLKTLQSFLARHPVVTRINTRWGDMDAFEHINNCNYFRYQEEARLQFFESVLREVSPQQTEFDVQQYITAKALGPILGDTYCKFKFPLVFPDTLLVGSTISTLDDLSPDRYILSHAIWSTQNNLVAAEGYSTVVSYDFRAAKAVDFPSSLVAAIHELLKKDSLEMLPPPVRK